MDDSRHAWRLALAAVAVFVLGACSGDEEPKAAAGAQKDEHVWKEQTRALDKSRDVERQIGEAAARRQKAAQ